MANWIFEKSDICFLLYTGVKVYVKAILVGFRILTNVSMLYMFVFLVSFLCGKSKESISSSLE